MRDDSADLVRSKIDFLVRHGKPFLANTKERTETRGYAARRDSLSKTILQGTLDGGRRRGRQRKCWMDNDGVNVPAHARTAHDGLPKKIVRDEFR